MREEDTVNRTNYHAVPRTLIDAMSHITANDLKTRGIAAIEACLAGGRREAVVSVRGADRYVVMELAEYQRLRECELEAALVESRADMDTGRFISESAAAHVARLQAMISSEDIAQAASHAGSPPAKVARAKRSESVGPSAKTARRRAG